MTRRDLPPNIYRTKGVLYFYKRPGPWVRLETQFPEGAPIPFALHQERERMLNARRDKKSPAAPPRTPVDVRLKACIKSAKLRAKKQGVPFSLTMDWAINSFEEQGRKCAVTQLPINGGGKHDPWQPSIDRIVPKDGYTPENCRLVAYIYNCARNQFSESDLLKMCEALVK